MIQSILQGGVSPFDEIFTTEFGFQKFARLSEIIILVCFFFFNLRLFDGVHFHYSQVLLSFLFSVNSDSFLINITVLFFWLFVFFCFSLLAWHIFLSKISFLYPDCIFLLFVFESLILFQFFNNSLMSSMYIM